MEAYIDIAGAIIEATVGCGGSDVDEAAGGSSESSKQRQPDSVVTLPAPPPPWKRGLGPRDLDEAGWLTRLIRPPLPRYAEHIALEATAEVEDVALISGGHDGHAVVLEADDAVIGPGGVPGNQPISYMAVKKKNKELFIYCVVFFFTCPGMGSAPSQGRFFAQYE